MIEDSKLKKIREASCLSQKGEKEADNFLNILAAKIHSSRKKIIEANVLDVRRAKEKNLSRAFTQRLKVGNHGVDGVIESINRTMKLKNGLGEVMEKRKLENGVLLQKVRVPIGVIFVIYEARPEVTVDVAALCIKSGNCAILKGGSEALHTNSALYKCIFESLGETGYPVETISFLPEIKRKNVYSLLRKTNYIDLVVARGGYKMVKDIQEKSKIPVLAHSAGGARIYVDRTADLKMGEKIILNAKISKPAACNSVDTVLVDEKIAKQFVPSIVKGLSSIGVEVFGDEAVCDFAGAKRADKDTWGREFLDLEIGIKVVEGIEEAVRFVSKYTKRHTEGIIAGDQNVVNFFSKSVDCAAIFVNCSTRLHDGGIFGMGTEMGIATGKLHARGPVGLNELTTYKWIASGSGQVRE
ncbi:glutamate-5-semialdehyde dehydrogenase [Patescibacteria group bacterium]|nr:glutamate-5-semialdehyde dehydrogenase [Patescibacteria group bacterium]MCL5797569.1 glutamate-5-semialdehyde dehydrogenase [Patescibacteria group bacterium]